MKHLRRRNFLMGTTLLILVLAGCSSTSASREKASATHSSTTKAQSGIPASPSTTAPPPSTTSRPPSSTSTTLAPASPSAPPTTATATSVPALPATTVPMNAQCAPAQQLVFSQLPNSTFFGANWSNCTEAGVTMNCVNLSNAVLTNVNLAGASLVGAEIGGAILTNVNFSNTDLDHMEYGYGASFTGDSWSNTTCPDGTNSSADGNTCTNNLGATDLSNPCLPQG